MSNLIGQSLGRYHVLEQLGEGGMATVYKAFDTRLETDVAVKVIRVEKFTPEVLSRALKRFEREAKALARLTHPNIVRVIDYGEYDGRPYIVMPLLLGGTLKQLLKQRQRIPWQEAARLLLPIARALEYAHKENIIHRDIKPSNIMITASGEPMLMDFGVAKILEEEATTELTGSSMAIGTPEYMAPEQVTAKTVDHRVDIYGLGIVYYEMVTGRRPYEADTPLAVMFKHATDPLPRPGQFLPGLPDAVERVLIKALAKKPDDRYPEMAPFILALERLATGDIKLDAADQVPAASARADQTQATIAQSGTWDTRLQPTGTRTAPAEAPVPPPPAAKSKTFWLTYVIGLMLLCVVAAIIWGVSRNGSSSSATNNSNSSYTVATNAPLDQPAQNLEQTYTQATMTMMALLTQAAPADAPYQAPTAVPPTEVPTAVPTPVPDIGSTTVRQQDGMTMVYVPAGNFNMGSPTGAGYSNERPQHSVYLDAYWIDQTTVTTAMFQSFVNSTEYTTDAERSGAGYVYSGNNEMAPLGGANWRNPQGSGGVSGSYPVTQISWQDAVNYCQWAGARLPTEAEWEKAARGADGRTYPWGNQGPSGSLLNFADSNLNAPGWSDNSINDGFRYAAPVGSYYGGISPYGALDMAGNVYQWVYDAYSKTYYSSSPSSNPQNTSGGERVMRGGSFNSNADNVRSAVRGHNSPSYTASDVGFRCVVGAGR